MMEKKKINVSLFRVVNDIAPFVLIDFLDDNADEHTGAMLLDSASQSNVLLSRNKDMVSYSYGVLDKTELKGLGEKAVTAENVQVNFTLGDTIFQESFCIADGDLPDTVGDYPLIGLLGNSFLSAHHLVIDFSDFTLHTSCVNEENLQFAECDYFFPMDCMLAAYGVPVVPLALDGQQVAAMIDTGSTDNVISTGILKDNQVAFKMKEGEDEMKGIGGSIRVKEAVVPFSLLSMQSGSTDKDPGGKKRMDNFKLTASPFLSARKVKVGDEITDLPQVDAALGCPFIARQGWILDFGLGVIYKKKSHYLTEVPSGSHSSDDHSMAFYDDATKTGMPYIQVTEGEFKGMILMLDTGSTVNVLFGSAFNELRDKFELEEETTNLIGMDGFPSEVRKARTTMIFNGEQCGMSFLVSDNDDAAQQLQQSLGFPIAGTLGTPFMLEQGWLIDFTRQKVFAQPHERLSSND